MIYIYGMRLRPAGPGCQPIKGLMTYGRKIKIGGEFIDIGRYHDILVYDRELSDIEIKGYELDFIDSYESGTIENFKESNIEKYI